MSDPEAVARAARALTVEEMWMVYGLLCAEVERREGIAFAARLEPLSALKTTEAAAWRTIRGKVRLAIEAAVPLANDAGSP